MADPILTESEASLAVEDLGWRYLLDCLTTAVTVGGVVAGTCLSAFWFFRVLRRFGLRVRFVQP